MQHEQTLVLIKPDGVKRHLVGKIISRFEDVGLKIVAMKMVWVDEEFARKHYPLDEEWAKGIFEKTKKSYEKEGKEFPYKSYLEHGGTIQSWLIKFIMEGPIIAMILEGVEAIEVVRKVVGSTEPKSAPSGTIRGDFAHMNYALADERKIGVRNLIHASGTKEDAKKEIVLWFKKDEVHDYQSIQDFCMY